MFCWLMIIFYNVKIILGTFYASNGIDELVFNSETTAKTEAIFTPKTERSSLADIPSTELILANANESSKITLSVIKDAARRRRTLLDVIVTKIVQHITVSRTTPKPTIPDLHSVYLKSKRLRDHIKKKMIKYKIRKKKNQKIDEKLGKKRGVSRKIVTTTKRVPMRKSKYYIRKYVRKNLYKMTTTTPKPTRDPWIYWTEKKEAKKKKSKIKRLLEFYKQKQNRVL
ncbi:uncharacterized protein LOC121736670 [Aricia agestis]|uniref:uncharacterized protein LOC121736670 n=1 Tax=Aricia agestis TaxID=91739 RepID=UPI001C20C081|nr:uncharacterized protein LOC121736670 [Aricia agestis]